MKTQDMLRAILRQSGQTQDELARALGVSRQALSNWLNGTSEPRAKKRQQIVAYYLQIVGTDEIADELLNHVLQEAETCTLSVQELLGSTAVVNSMIVQMTYHTNSIEGSTMTVSDNEAVLLHDKVLTNRSAREQLEARNHRAALLWLLERIDDGNFTWNEKLAQELHIRLMNGLLLEAGSYRNHGVLIMGTQVPLTNYVKIPQLMKRLFARQMPQSVAEMATFHAEFEQIHPFSDGNGRVGRLLLAAIAIQQGIVPPIVERERRAAYYHALQLAQTKGNAKPLEYLLAQEIVAAYKKLGL